MSKRKLSQGLQCITKFFKLSADLDRNSTADEILSENTERVPVEEKTLGESKKNNKASIKVVNEIDGSGVIVDQDSSDLDNVTENTELEDSVDADTDMYPRFNNHGNPSQRGRLNQNYYNARQDERYRQSYENQRDFQYPRESYDRHDIPFNQHPNRNHYENYRNNYQGDDRRCYEDFQEQESFTRPPIHNRRYNEGEVYSNDHYQYENTNFNRSRRRNQSHDNIGSQPHERVQRSFSSEVAGNRQDFKKSDSYSSSENSKGPEKSRNEPSQNRQNQNVDGKGDQSCQKDNKSTDKNNVNKQDLSPKPVVNKNSVSSVFSPGRNIYQSDQYFSAVDKLQDGEEKTNVKTTPSKNLKRHMSDIIGNHSESKGAQNSKGKSPVRRQESAPVGSGKEKTPNKMDKMDFSSIKKALNEVKSQDDTCMKGKQEMDHNTSECQTINSPIQNKTIDNKMESSPIERKRSVDNVKEKTSSVQETVPLLPLQRKNSKEKIHGGKAQSSPRSRNSSGDSQGILSPKTDAKQRSAFHVVLPREDRSSEISKMSPKENPLSPLDRKRSSSGDLKPIKQVGIQSPDSKVIDSTYNAISEEEGSLSGSPEKSGISLKSALSYPEWKRLKAQQDLALQKEREKNRKCIELANTPEEYRKLLKLKEKKAREKERSRRISETETEKKSEKSVENNDSDEEIESSQLPTLHNSQNSFQAIQDKVGSDEDIDLEESDDDDLEAPSFLFSLEEASTRPIPSTPTKITHLESPGPCSPTPEADLTDITTKTLLSSKFSLDQLVSEKVDKSEDQRDYEEMHAKLEEGLKKGGFVKDTLEIVEPQEDEILPEHEKHLQEFKILDSVISEVHPGDVIFQPLLHQSRFTGSLSLQTCGFTPGASYIDKYLSTLQPKDYSLLLTSNILQNTLDSVACQEAVLRWLFLLMSVHSNQLVTQGCHKTLLEHLNRQIHFKQLPQTWIPPIPDVLSVFCNYGCEVSRLLPDNIADSTEEYSSHIIQEEQNGMIPRGGNSICRNLHLVLNIIGQCLHSRPRYSSKQLTDLLIILCHVAMDKSHNSEVLPHEFQVCLKGILKSYSSNYWDAHCNELCHTLFKITGHHHNRQYLAQLLPEDKRGAYLQRRLAYLYLQDMFDVGRDTDIKDYKIKCLHVYLTKLQHLVTTDVYKLSSAISYLDIAVGNSAIKVSEKEDLQYLCDQLKKISGDVKDSVQMLDRSWVKDMMVRVCSKWTLYLLTVGSKQKSMFAYTKKKTPAVFEIKTVEASQGDISSQSEGEEESKDVPKDIIVDSRTPIITDIQCIMDENSNQSHSKTFTLDNENFENEIDKEIDNTVIIKIEKPDIIPISDSPMEVDLTEDDLPDLLDHS
ncbi:SMC5-SMC6 complex localization factor protein 2-like isoform X2 [Mytilus californianus]|uniref:SMC5-SMC6 complex localization factor protein 2-like isoform X2 n=1 Tax=Mytilus californianus TaxID=6549 RepID=UPI00224533ED|nr:SMC5-SMC6 complex localization factor protein 2-like isoform X2 [Mytilus californianus]